MLHWNGQGDIFNLLGGTALGHFSSDSTVAQERWHRVSAGRSTLDYLGAALIGRRACAVYGGTYVLGSMAKPSDITVESEGVKLSLPCHPRPITARHVVAAPDQLPSNLYPSSPSRTVYRAQCIAILTSLPPVFKRQRTAETEEAEGDQGEKEEDDTAGVLFPPVDGRPAIRALLMGEGTGSCPPGQCKSPTSDTGPADLS